MSRKRDPSGAQEPGAIHEQAAQPKSANEPQAADAPAPGAARPATVALLLTRLTQRTREAIDTACRIAQEEQRALAGIFVEDVEILRAATMPFTRALDTVTAAPRPIERDDVERAQAQEAHAVAELVAAAAERYRVPASFRIERGTLLEHARREARPGKVVIAAAAGVGAGAASRLPHARAEVESVLAFAQSPDASRTLLHTMTRGLPASSRLTVCLFTPDEAQATALKREAAEIEAACERVEAVLGRKVRWMRSESEPGLASIEALLDALRPGIIGLAPEVLEAQLARITLVLRRLGGTLILRD